MEQTEQVKTMAEPTTTTHGSSIKIHLTTVQEKNPGETEAYQFQSLHKSSVDEVNNTLSHHEEPSQTRPKEYVG